MTSVNDLQVLCFIDSSSSKGWEVAIVTALCCRKFWMYGRIFAKMFRSRKEFAEFWDRLGRLSQKSECVTEGAAELGAGSSSPFCSSIYWNQQPCSSAALHRGVKGFRYSCYCATKFWKHIYQDFWDIFLKILLFSYCNSNFTSYASLKPWWSS